MSQEDNLLCPGCAAEISIQNPYDEQKCCFCGTAYDIDELKSGSIKPINEKTYNLMILASAAYDGGNLDDALECCNKAIEEDVKNSAAWLYKATCQLYKSSISDLKIKEVISIYNNALKYSSEENFVKAVVAKYLAEFISKFKDHNQEFFVENAGKSADLSLKNQFDDNKAELLVGVEYALGLVDSISNENNEYNHEYLSEIKLDLALEGYSLTFLNDERLEDCKRYFNIIKDISPEGAEELHPPRARDEAGGCFIATAAMGDYDHPLVVDLRSFRDEILMKCQVGRFFVKKYYQLSPPLAGVISKNRFLKLLTLIVIVKPLSKLSRIFLAK